MQSKTGGKALASVGLTVIVTELVFSVIYRIVLEILSVFNIDMGFLGTDTGILFFTLVTYLVMMVPAAVLLIKLSSAWHGSDALSALIPSEKTGAGRFVCAVLTCCFFGYVGNYVSAALNYVAEVNGMPVPQGPTFPSGNMFTLGLTVLIVAVLPALLEELIIRGAVYGFCSQTGPVCCGLISGIVFALFHCNFAQFPSAFMFGFMAGYLVCVYKNIWISIAAHFINNLVSCLLTYDGGEVYFAVSSLLFILFFALTVVGFILMLVKYNLFREGTKNSFKGFVKVFSVPIMWIFIAVSLVLSVVTLNI